MQTLNASFQEDYAWVAWLACLLSLNANWNLNLLQVNSCTGKMGKSVIEAAFAAGLDPVPVSFARQENSGKTIEIEGKEFQLHGPSERENILASVLEEYPGLIVVDYSTPTAVNGKHM